MTFSTSVVGENSKQPLLSITLQVAFICAGCTHADYTKVLGKASGMCTVKEHEFYATLTHIKAWVNEHAYNGEYTDILIMMTQK